MRDEHAKRISLKSFVVGELRNFFLKVCIKHIPPLTALKRWGGDYRAKALGGGIRFWPIIKNFRFFKKTTDFNDYTEYPFFFKFGFSLT
jgi:hypothetical protein